MGTSAHANILDKWASATRSFLFRMDGYNKRSKEYHKHKSEFWGHVDEGEVDVVIFILATAFYFGATMLKLAVYLYMHEEKV